MCALLVFAAVAAIVIAAEPSSAGNPVPAMRPIPEGNSQNVELAGPAANLWVCDEGNAACSGPGEASLVVTQRAYEITSGDADADTVADGLGAYEIDIDVDTSVIASVSFSDLAFASGSVEATCTEDAISQSRWGCARTAQASPPGPLGEFDLATVTVVPDASLAGSMRPSTGNQVLTLVQNNGCEAADFYGYPVIGSLGAPQSGLPVCGDLIVAVRILQADIDLDCDVDIVDEQSTAFRLGSALESPLYSTWYDLHPQTPDGDIDIVDLQMVFGRDGSTCQNPIPAQPPL